MDIFNAFKGIAGMTKAAIDDTMPRQAVVTRVDGPGVWVRFTPVDSSTPEMWFPSTVAGLSVGAAGWVHPLAGGKGRFIADDVPLVSPHNHDERYYTEAEVNALIDAYRPRTARGVNAPGVTISTAGDYLYSGSAVTFTGLVPNTNYTVRADVGIRTFSTGTLFLIASTGAAIMESLYQGVSEDNAFRYDSLLHTSTGSGAGGSITVTPGIRWNGGSIILTQITLTATITRN